MNSGKTLFAQLMDLLPWSTFTRIVARYGGDERVRTLSCAEHYRAMAFAQLTYRESLRDIVACLRARPKLQYHLDFRGWLTRTNFAYANEHRDWRVFAAVAEVLIRRAARLYNQPAEDLDFPQVAFALDASIIHLSLKRREIFYFLRIV